MTILVWLAVGIVGNALCWLAIVGLHKSGPLRCPTPRAIFFMVLVSCFGAFSLVLGGVLLLNDWMERRPRRRTWWTRPICSNGPQTSTLSPKGE